MLNPHLYCCTCTSISGGMGFTLINNCISLVFHLIREGQSSDRGTSVFMSNNVGGNESSPSR